jgi:hypothetical protein
MKRGRLVTRHGPLALAGENAFFGARCDGFVDSLLLQKIVEG